MAKYVMITQSAAHDGRDEEYNAWYDSRHLHEICAIPGVTEARRLKATPVALGTPGAPYIALYEIETDDLGAFMAEMGKRSADGSITRSEAMNRDASVLWIYADITPPD